MIKYLIFLLSISVFGYVKAQNVSKEKLPLMIDTGISGLKLLDPESCLASFPKNNIEKYFTNKEMKVFDTGVAVNTPNEKLIIIITKNAKLCEIAGFDVRRTLEEAIPTIDTSRDFSKLQTDKNIQLGDTRLEIIRKLGKSFTHEKSNGREVLTFSLTPEKDTLGYLKTKGFDKYSGRYEFEKGLLVRFRFGFEKVSKVEQPQ